MMLGKGVFRLNKKFFLLPIAGLISLGLAGCGDDGENAMQEQNSKNTRPFGYYTNENHDDNGNARFLRDDDGPITEIMDNSFGENDRNGNGQNGKNTRPQVMYQNENPEDPTQPLTRDQKVNREDGRFGTKDANYHGHLNNDKSGRARTSYYNDYDGALVEKTAKLASAVPNVKDARTVVYKNDVVIAADLATKDNEAETKRKIAEVVRPHVKGRTITVVTDVGDFSSIRTIDNDLRDGNPRQQIDMNIRNMINSVKNRTR